MKTTLRALVAAGLATAMVEAGCGVPDETSRRATMLDEIRATYRSAGTGTPDARVMEAMGRVPRHEFVPLELASAAALRGTPGPMGAWSLQKHMDDMGAAGVTRSMVSITTPGLPAGEQGRTQARSINEEAAKLAADNGGKIVQRIRPRFNSEYVWNRPGLDAVGGLALDYHTKPLWITQP